MSLPPFDKYFYYNLSVQSADADVEFFDRVYKELRSGKKAQSLREDFCGAFDICCEWVKLDSDKRAYGVDFDSEPLEYGKRSYIPRLSEPQKQRVELVKGDVLETPLKSVDITCAVNFSYFIFKERKVLKEYFQRVYNSLNENGVFVMDCFGGSQCQESNEEETEYEDEKFSYFWDQDSFDPLNNNAVFNIHFKRFGEAKRQKVFTYDWRMWSIPELKDILEEVGFKKTDIYWEGTDEDGEGDGVYTKVKDGEKGEECEAWVAYLVASK